VVGRLAVDRMPPLFPSSKVFTCTLRDETQDCSVAGGLLNSVFPNCLAGQPCRGHFYYSFWSVL